MPLSRPDDPLSVPNRWADPDPFDPEGVCLAAGLAGLELLAETPSTMDRARELAASDAPLPLAVVAQRQTLGRGRRGARWWQPDGALAMSIVIDGVRGATLGEAAGARGVTPLWSLVCGVALAETLAILVPEIEPQIRWPNDVVASGRKLAGILVETAPQGRVIFGIGVNTTGSASAAPHPLRQRVGTLPDLAGRSLPRGQLLAALVPRLLGLLSETARDPGVLVERYRPLCSLSGSQVTFHREDGHRLSGRCHSIDADGALVLDTAVGLVHLVRGSLTDPAEVWRGDLSG